MPALHIRDISDTLMKRLKSDAALNGITLREHVINQLGGQKTADRPVEGLPRAEELHVGRRRASRSERVSASCPTCEHGTAKGNRCWQCGGLAKVQKEAET